MRSSPHLPNFTINLQYDLVQGVYMAVIYNNSVITMTAVINNSIRVVGVMRVRAWAHLGITARAKGCRSYDGVSGVTPTPNDAEEGVLLIIAPIRSGNVTVKNREGNEPTECCQ